MSPKSAAILSNPDARGHIVYPYTDETQVADAVCLFASAGLQNGDAVLLVMTGGHCEPIRRRLEKQGFNLKELEATGQLACEDARDLLSTFLFDGIIDDYKFKTKLGRMIERAKCAGGHHRSVRVFGEMVDLLWQTDPRTTLRLEELWNEVIEAHQVPLLCAYSLAGIRPGLFQRLFWRVILTTSGKLPEAVLHAPSDRRQPPQYPEEHRPHHTRRTDVGPMLNRRDLCLK